MSPTLPSLFLSAWNTLPFQDAVPRLLRTLPGSVPFLRPESPGVSEGFLPLSVTSLQHTCLLQFSGLGTVGSGLRLDFDSSTSMSSVSHEVVIGTQ